jgi:hypothetical protein
MPISGISLPSGCQRACSSVMPEALRSTAPRRKASQRRYISTSSGVPDGNGG